MAIITNKEKIEKQVVKKSRTRNLKTGERKRASGGYEYRYTDKSGKRHSLYARTLEELDEKKDEISLNNIYNIKPTSYRLNDVYEMWKDHKTGIKDNTKQNWCYMYERYAKGDVGTVKIRDLKFIDLQEFYVRLLGEKSLSASTVDSIHTVIHSVLEYAIRNDWLRNNPAKQAFRDIKKQYQKTTKRVALTSKQQETLINFLATNEKYRRWWSIFVFMLETGLRVGELIGLTDEDIENDIISVNHTLIYYNRYVDDGKSYYEIHTPKTKKSIRNVPLSQLARNALKFEKDYQNRFEIKCQSHFRGKKIENGIEVERDFDDFIFLNRFGAVLNESVLNRALKRIIEECNSEMERTSNFSESDKLPRFSCHNLRHTYITRLCEKGINPRVIMELAGHSTMDITMQIYTTIDKDFAKDVFQSFDDYMKDKNLPQDTPNLPHRSS